MLTLNLLKPNPIADDPLLTRKWRLIRAFRQLRDHCLVIQELAHAGQDYAATLREVYGSDD